MQIEAKDIFDNMDDGEVWLRVQGTSMRPFLRDSRDTVILRKPDKLEIGDIVVFKRKETYIMHRIIETGNGYITTLGDNLKVPEKNIPFENVCAKVIGAVRDGKRINPDSAVWKFYSRVYIKPDVRKMLTKIRSWR